VLIALVMKYLFFKIIAFFGELHAFGMKSRERSDSMGIFLELLMIKTGCKNHWGLGDFDGKNRLCRIPL